MSEAKTNLATNLVRFEDVSKFYGEVLGVNHVSLEIGPGITSLVGPNGSGKTTLMNLATGLLHPTRGKIDVLGISPDRPEDLFRLVGYATQFDSFPSGVTGRRFVESTLRLHGFSWDETAKLTERALERVGLVKDASRRVAGYSKGMRQRIRLAQAIAHEPRVLILDEPLNGLDPMARAEVLDLFRKWADAGCHVILSSHILHEVDLVSDRVILVKGGYIVAAGEITGLRSEVKGQPAQVHIDCDRPTLLAARLLTEDRLLAEVQLHNDGRGLLVRTRDADLFFAALNRHIVEQGIEVRTVVPADDDTRALYRYLLENLGEAGVAGEAS